MEMEAFVGARGCGRGLSLAGRGVAGCGLPVGRGVEMSVSEGEPFS